MQQLKEMDWSLVARELIKALRAKKSQAWINQRMDAKSNLVHRWESGHTKPTWEDFINLLQVLKIDFRKLLKSYFRFDKDFSKFHQFLSFIIANKKVSEVAKLSGMNVTKLRRLMNQQTQPTLVDFLQIIFGLDAIESLSLCYDMVQNRSIPSLDEAHSTRLKLTEAYHNHPDLGLLLTALLSPQYQRQKKHSDELLIQMTGLEHRDVTSLLKICMDLEIVTFRKNLYYMNEFRVSDRSSPEQMLKTRKFWIEKALKKLSTSTIGDAFGSIVFSASKTSKDEIIALYLRFFNDVKKVIDHDQSVEKAPLIMNFQLFSPGENNTPQK